MQQKLAQPQSITLSDKSAQLIAECLFENNGSTLDMDYFIKTLTSIKLKGVRPDIIGSVITHYASKWLPYLARSNGHQRAISDPQDSPKSSATASWMKKKLFIESLMTILPTEKDSVPCSFLLRLLRVAIMVGVEDAYLAELEKRISWRLDEATLEELMVPSFSHTRATLLDVELVFRLVKGFVDLEKSGAAIVKVAKLVDSYLAEAAVDCHLTLPEFESLAGVLPSHARSIDDGLYRAVDIYLKAHSGLSKQDRKRLWNRINSRKLSTEASLHAAQNERLPVRAVIQVLLSEQTKLNKHIDWSGSMSGMMHSPSTRLECLSRSQSKREISIQHMEIKRLKEDVLRLQSQCMHMEVQIEKLSEKKKGYGFGWKKLGLGVFKANKVQKIEEKNETGFGPKMQMGMNPRLVQRSMSNK